MLRNPQGYAKETSMDSGLFNIIYFDRRATADRFVDRGHSKKAAAAHDVEGRDGVEQDVASLPEVRKNIQALLAVFRQVHICRTGTSCLTTISQLTPGHGPTIPTILLVAVMSHDDDQPPSSPGGNSPISPGTKQRLDPDNMAGMPFLHHVSFEIQQHKLPSMVIPVAVLCHSQTSDGQPAAAAQASLFKTDSSPFAAELWKGPTRILRYLDAGAVDVLMSPLSEDRVSALPSHAYRTYKEASRAAPFSPAKRSRKTSWVGVGESKPYSYLREAMVSGLMDGICNPDHEESAIDANEITIPPERRQIAKAAVGTWAFSAHDFTDDELLYGALCMLEHTLSMPELEKWRISTEHLTRFLIACRRVYNSFVLYHNFRHACDVLQAIFFFLLQIGALPPYEKGNDQETHKRSPIASLVGPFHALTLLISAIGHDVGHPGVNNLFLVTLNAPLAQLYNDRSVLESFHCAAYSQILRRHWPAAFKDTTMRKLMINTILATDMALHAQYMTQMGNLHEKLMYNGNTLDGWSEKILEEYRELTCCLLIKCADICNVARKFETAEEWARILTDEFHNQGLMEQELTMPSCLFGGPPVLNDVLKMGNSQISFMNIFAGPLFEGVTNVLPPMHICVDEIAKNKSIWQVRIDKEKEKRERVLGVARSPTDGTASPRSGSVTDLRETSPNPRSNSMHLGGATTDQIPMSSPTASGDTARPPEPAPESTNPTPSATPDDSVQSNPTSTSPSQSLPLSYATGSTSLASMASHKAGVAPTSQPMQIPTRNLSLSPPPSSSNHPEQMKRVRTMDASLVSSSAGSGAGSGSRAGDSDKDIPGTNTQNSKFGLRYWRTRLKSIGGGPSPSRSPTGSP